jgi:adenylate cyclase class 2
MSIETMPIETIPIEVEQKYRSKDRAALVAKFAALGAVAEPATRQVDTYYAHPARDFAVTDEALRIRCVGDADVRANFITYKGPKLDATTKTRREIELPLSSGALSAEQFGELLQALSFRRVAEVTKVRQAFRLQREGQAVEFALDNVQDVGDFVELEIVVATEAQIEPAKQLIQALASELQLAGAERRSYLEMLLATRLGSG